MNFDNQWLLLEIILITIGLEHSVHCKKEMTEFLYKATILEPDLMEQKKNIPGIVWHFGITSINEERGNI